MYEAPPSVSHWSTKWVSPANANVTGPGSRAAAEVGEDEVEAELSGDEPARRVGAASLVQPAVNGKARAGMPKPAFRISRRVNSRGRTRRRR